MLKFVTRKDWRAQPPKETQPLLFPIRSVVFKYTETEKCLSEYECSTMIRVFQDEALNKGLPDIPYNFLAGGDLSIYEGRGWDNRVFDRKLVIALIARISDDDELINQMSDLVQTFIRKHDNKVRLAMPPDSSRPQCTHNMPNEWQEPSLRV